MSLAKDPLRIVGQGAATDWFSAAGQGWAMEPYCCAQHSAAMKRTAKKWHWEARQITATKRQGQAPLREAKAYKSIGGRPLMARTTRKEQAARRMIRDVGMRDVLSKQKLIDLLTLWETRLETAADAAFAQKCREMIWLYTERLRRMEAFKSEASDSAAL